MGISGLLWRGWGWGGESRAGPAPRSHVCPHSKPPGQADRQLRRGKPEGFILRPSVRKGLWSQFSRSTAFLKVRQQVHDLLDLGKHFKREQGGGKKKRNQTRPEGSFLFLPRDRGRREKVLVRRQEREMKICLFSDC